MDRLEVANKKAEETKSLMEETVSQMSQNLTHVEGELVPNAVELAMTGQETKELAEDIEREEKCRRCRVFCCCFSCFSCCRPKRRLKYQGV